ncbi:hypothetical protein [Spirosoma rigui]|uniref:hypothetical protein n=1 Tax=Spirosoma rigui TaxID=564064 RepID=UPI0009B172C1|nr:hypothetical protein [Spirosoma rigui]
MKQPRVIQRLSGLFLATLLLFTAVWGHDGRVQQQVVQTKKAAATAGQEKTRKADGSQSTDAQLSATQFEAVVMSAPTVGGGSQTAFLLPAVTFMILMLLSVPLLRHFTYPHYFFSYLQHVFGHVIAPNAP